MAETYLHCYLLAFGTLNSNYASTAWDILFSQRKVLTSPKKPVDFQLLAPFQQLWSQRKASAFPQS